MSFFYIYKSIINCSSLSVFLFLQVSSRTIDFKALFIFSHLFPIDRVVCAISRKWYKKEFVFIYVSFLLFCSAFTNCSYEKFRSVLTAPTSLAILSISSFSEIVPDDGDENMLILK